MKEMSVEKLEWLITLTEDRVREMNDSPEKSMLKEMIGELREARQKALEA
jgi:hypothetical protein